MKKMLHLLSVLGLFPWLMSCDSLRQEVDPDRLNREAAKLVVTCFLSPQDTVLAVRVARSQPVLGDGTAATTNSGYGVMDATVTLSDGSRTVPLRYSNVPGRAYEVFPYYSVTARQLPIVAGRTYTILVLTPTGERAESSCTVPGPVAMTSVAFDSVTENQFGRQFKRYFVRGRWQDPSGQTNYYQMSGVFRYLRVCQNCTSSPPNQPREEFTDLYFDDDNSNLLTDRNTSGGAMISGRGFLSGYFDSGNNAQTGFDSQYKTATVTLNLLNVDQAYYQYQDAVARQSQVSGNPFAEPVPIPSNIQGALGCFGAYNRSTLTMTLK